MQPFIKLWVGSEYMLKDTMVILLVFYFCIYELTQFSVYIKKLLYVYLLPLICSILNICLNLILVRKFDVYGVVFATIVSSGCVSLPWVVHNVCKYIFREKPTDCLLKFVPYIFAGIIINVFLNFFVTKITLPAILEIVVKLLICIVVVNGWWYALFRKKKEFYTIMALMRKGVFVRRKGKNNG